MNGVEKVVKHLEMTQAIINRLGRNSFLLKSWSMTILVAAMVLIAREDFTRFISCVSPIPSYRWVLDFGRLLSLAGTSVPTSL